MIGIGLPARPRPDAHRLLLRDLLTRLPDAALVASSAEPWASATFEGARHLIALILPSRDEAMDFARIAGDLEFALHGHLVADIVAHPGPDGRVAIEALTVEEH